MKKFGKVLTVLLVTALVVCTLVPAFTAGEEMEWPNNRDEVTLYEDIVEADYDYYEAEFGELLDRARDNPEHPGYHGLSAVAVQVWDDSRDSTSGVGFEVDGGKEGGKRRMLIGYNSGFEWAQRMNLIVNGVNMGKVYFPTIAALDWTVHGVICVEVDLKPGKNEIQVRFSPDDYPCAFNLDFIAIEKEGVTGAIEPGKTVYEPSDEAKYLAGEPTPTPTPEPTPTPTPDPNKVNKVTLVVDQKAITLESIAKTETVELDAAPVIKDDRTFIPVRGMFESLGAEIGWDDATRTVTVTLDETVVEITIDSRRAKVNGEYVLLDVPPFIDPANNRTLIPLRFVSENLGFEVTWDDATRTIGVIVE